uniref:Uncharacterized protein n=3 Tax=Meloidogyne TaxID=189290 RepID=A0A6V7XTY0_MELEN|nr:unnamed protein product [Meloidogyne enterolobii]
MFVYRSFQVFGPSRLASQQCIRRLYSTELDAHDYAFMGVGADTSAIRGVLEKSQGIDRYHSRIYFRLLVSTREEPNMVYAQAGENKVVGCICEKDSKHVNYWILKNDGKARRCECEQWFKVVDAEPESV